MVKQLQSILDSQLEPATRLSESVVALTDKQKLSIYKKSQNSGIPVDILEEVYRRGFITFNKESFAGTPEQFAFDRVNSFISGGFAMELDEDLKKACWKGYEAIGMKKKNGKSVPNCVPVKENSDLDKVNQISKNLKNMSSKDKKLPHVDDGAPEMFKIGKKPVKESALLTTIRKVVSERCGCDSEKSYNKKLKQYRAVIEGKEISKQKRMSSFKDQIDFRSENELEAVKTMKEATYQGKKVTLNKRLPGDVKKSKVFVDPDGDGKAQKVNFGDKNMTIKKNIPARRKSFRARHNCDNPGPKTKARYWSCKAW
jgi:hypothetical protein